MLLYILLSQKLWINPKISPYFLSGFACHHFWVREWKTLKDKFEMVKNFSMSKYIYRSLSSRVIAASWWMFVLLMTLCYSANLAAFLTTSTFDDTFNSLNDLLNQNDLRYGIFEHQYPIIHNLLKVKRT